MYRILVAITFVLTAQASVHGGTPNWPMRELIIQSQVVLVATPIGAVTSGRFKATRVLLGTMLKEGDEFKVDDLSVCDLTVPAIGDPSARKPVAVREVMLFLGFQQTDAPHFWLTASGLRIQTADHLYYAVCLRGKEAYVLHPFQPEVQWDDLLRKAYTDALEIRRVHFLKEIDDPHRRNTALLDWIARRRAEFGESLTIDDGVESGCGWGSLQDDVFQWILESGITADCWAAVQLYAELNAGYLPEMRQYAFGTREGRNFLLGVASTKRFLGL